jgi:hypothetical protein
LEVDEMAKQTETKAKKTTSKKTSSDPKVIITSGTIDAKLINVSIQNIKKL